LSGWALDPCSSTEGEGSQFRRDACGILRRGSPDEEASQRVRRRAVRTPTPGRTSWQSEATPSGSHTWRSLELRGMRRWRTCAGPIHPRPAARVCHRMWQAAWQVR